MIRPNVTILRLVQLYKNKYYDLYNYIKTSCYLRVDGRGWENKYRSESYLKTKTYIKIGNFIWENIQMQMSFWLRYQSIIIDLSIASGDELVYACHEVIRVCGPNSKPIFFKMFRHNTPLQCLCKRGKTIEGPRNIK